MNSDRRFTTRFHSEVYGDILLTMSAPEILAELEKLSRKDLEAVEIRLRELMRARPANDTWAGALAEVAGSVNGFPEDYSEKHDSYRRSRFGA